jgi:mRNA interferase MazF
MASTEDPRRGEVWLTSFGAARPDEPGKNRPAIVVSADRIIAGSSQEPVVVVPLSSSVPPSALRPEVTDVEGVERPSRAVCGAVRGVARSRLLHKLGVLMPATLDEVERSLALILGLNG